MPIEITMPRLSDTMEQGTVIKWMKSEGDEVSAGEVIADVETDKATMEMPVYDDGTLAKILIPEGQTVEVGSLIAVLAGEDEDASDVASQFADGAPKKASKAPDSKQPAPGPEDVPAPDATSRASVDGDEEAQPSQTQSSAAPAQANDGKMRVSPVARRLAEEHDLDLRMLQGSGPSGRIIKRDVENAIDAGNETAASVAPSAQGITKAPQQRQTVEATRVTEPLAVVQQNALAKPSTFGLQEQTVSLSGMRQTIARRLVESKTTIPHYQVTVSVDMEPLLDLRRDLNESLADQGVKLSVNDFLVRACALSMYEHPYFNASWEEDQIRVHGRVNVGIAVSLPEERGGGLVVATIFDADRKTLREISYESKMLAEKARTRGLSQDELTGSTFTLSNLGMFGVDNFTAIINPPNSAILAVGAAAQKPVVRNGELVIGHEMAGTLSCDHRVIDGAMAARYLQTLKGLFEHPAMLMV